MAASSAGSAVELTHPSATAVPPCASIATAIRSPNRVQAASSSAGEPKAAVPRMTRAAPEASARSIASSVRIPPPTWTGTRTARRSRPMAASLTGRPPNAPSRSTTWSQGAPLASHRRAWAAGSSPYTRSRSARP